MALVRGSSEAARRTEWREQGRLRLALERPLFTQLRRELARTGSDSSRAYEAGGAAAVDIALQGHPDRLKAILDPAWFRTANAFGARVIGEAAQAVGQRSAPPVERRDAQSVFEASVLAWINDQGGQQIQQISGTTRKQIMTAIEAGEAAGESVDQIKRRIMDVTAGAIGRNRARTIARTETHNASTFGQQQAAVASGLAQVTEREWVAALDARTRESHIAANRQRRAFGVPYDVGGAKLMRPGDPNGPASEVIQCRCVEILVVEDEFVEAA